VTLPGQILRRWWWIGALGLGLSPGPGLSAVPEANPEAARAVIVANSADPDSRPLAEYYAKARGIPLANILALPLPVAETVSWPDFSTQVFNPLQAGLIARGWISAIPLRLADPYGRTRIAANSHRISYLVLMRGVPLRIDRAAAWLANPPPAGRFEGLFTNQASVDGELAILAGWPSGETVPINGFIKNPLYQKLDARGLEAAAIVRVTRLDGPTPAAVRGMIDGALAAERDGLAGRAYVDLGSAYPQGNAWLDLIARRCDEAGFDLTVDREPATFGPLVRFDAPALYFGWYAGNADGPFLLPGFRFPPGAVAVHIHSFSAETLRSPTANWCGPLIARGAAATLGNVWEPYLEYSHHLDLFVDALLRGRTFGEAAYYALPVLSWQAVALGDPLYRPFARPFGEQWAQRRALPAALQPYVALRQARLELRAGHKDEARQVLRTEFLDTPSLAGGLALAQADRDGGGRDAAVRDLAFLGLLGGFAPADVGLVRTGAALLMECGAPDQALDLYAKVLAQPPAGEAEVALLEEAIRAANAAARPARADPWQARLRHLKPAPMPVAPNR